MKTLYESILSSNKAGIADTIKSIISKMPKGAKELEKLNKLWDAIGLGLPGAEWIIQNSVLCFGRLKAEDIWGNKIDAFLYRPISSDPVSDMFLHFDGKINMSYREMKKYAEKICKKLKAKGSERMLTYEIKFE